MRLKQSILDWKLPLPGQAEIANLPLGMKAAREVVEAQFSNIQPKRPSKFDLDQLYKLISSHFRNKKELDGLKLRDKRRIPWVLFTYPTDDPGRLAEDRSFFKSFMGWILTELKPGCISTLLFVFLREYPVRLSTFHQWRKGLISCLNKSLSPRIVLIRKKYARYDLLTENGPQWFADHLLKSDAPVDSLFKDAGLTGQLENQGFSNVVYNKILQRIFGELSTGKQISNLLNRFFSYLYIEDENGRRLRSESGTKGLAEAFLLPYVDDKAHPEHQKKIQAFLVDAMGDPRVSRTRWAGVDQRAMEVMYGWLVGATLDVFFSILDRTADKIWFYRKAFWNAYYKKGHIRHVWAVLGRDAISIAKQMDDQKTTYGELSRSYTRNQSVLLLRIGDLVIAEWSHNGKCRIWKDTEQNQSVIPRLYNAISPYVADSLREVLILNKYIVYLKAVTGSLKSRVIFEERQI